MIAARNLSAAVRVVSAMPGRTLLLMLPMIAGTALAMATLAIERGVTRKSDEAAESFGLDLVTVRSGSRVIAGVSEQGKMSEEDVKALQQEVRGYKAIIGVRREDKTPVSVGSRNGVYKVFGVTPDWANVRNFPAERGKFVDQDDLDNNARVCLVGRTVQHELFGDQDPMDQEVSINQVPFKVKGVLVERGASLAEGDRDARLIVPITTFYNRLYKRINLDQIVVQAKTRDPVVLADLAKQVSAVLRKQHHISEDQPEDVTVRTPQMIAETSRTISWTVFYMMLGLAGLFGIVAAVIIVLVAGQAIRARRGEIGIRRAIGATPSDIMQQIWAECLMISLLGGVIGTLIGLGGGWGLAHWRQAYFGFNPNDIFHPLDLLGPLFLVVLGSLAGLLPAQAATRLDPAQALRP
jgi:putative ABC transport system permease protein